jgi:hypothetical protein
MNIEVACCNQVSNLVKVLKARLITAQYERRGTMSEMLGKKEIKSHQRWPMIFDL